MTRLPEPNELWSDKASLALYVVVAVGLDWGTLVETVVARRVKDSTVWVRPLETFLLVMEPAEGPPLTDDPVTAWNEAMDIALAAMPKTSTAARNAVAALKVPAP